MKSFLLCLVLGTSLCSISQRNIDVLHYSNTLELNDTNDTLAGTTVIDMLIMESTDHFSLDLKSLTADGKGMIVTSAGYMIRYSYRKTYEHIQDKIVFRGSFSKGDTAEVTVVYKGIPANGLIISKNKYGKRTFFADNWPNRAHNWIPCNDDIADKATVEFIVTAPSQYQVVSNGVQIEETNLPSMSKSYGKKLTHWKEDVPLPTKVMVIGVAEFAVQHAGIINNCIPVSSWIFTENKAEGFHDYAPATGILQWFNDYIGPYPYNKLANVQSKTMFGGMENAGAIFYFENSVDGKQAHESLISHEIVHQWFGNMATEKSFAHLWLSEGFATYLTHIYMETKYGTDTLNKGMKEDREGVLDFVKREKRPVVDTTSNYMKLLNANSYQKGSWVLHMLRRQLGDSVFHKSIRDYYAAYAGKNADTKDLQKIFEMNSGKDLGQFFKQWLYTPANPALNITWKYLTDEKKVRVTVEQLQSAEPFVFPLLIAMERKTSVIHKGKTTFSQQLHITKKIETFTFPVSSKPLTFLPDPYVSLLFTATIKEEQ